MRLCVCVYVRVCVCNEESDGSADEMKYVLMSNDVKEVSGSRSFYLKYPLEQGLLTFFCTLNPKS